MALRFDPSALLAQGGIIHGLDDLGAAVANAMNSRAARKYQNERETRQRGEHLEDVRSSQTFQSGENALGRKATAELEGKRITAAEKAAEILRGGQWSDKLRADKEQLSNAVYAPIPQMEDVRVYDAASEKYGVKAMPVTPERRAEILRARRAQVQEFVRSYGPDHQDVLDSFDQWAKQPDAPTPAAPAPAAPPKFDPSAASKALMDDPEVASVARDYGVAEDGPVDQLAAWQELTRTGDSPLTDWLGAFQTNKTPAGQTHARTDMGRRERAGIITSRAQKYAAQFGKDPAAAEWAKQFEGPYGTEAVNANAQEGPIHARESRAVTKLPAGMTAPTGPPMAQGGSAVVGQPPAQGKTVTRAEIAARVAAGQFRTPQEAEAAAAAHGYTVVP